MAGACWLRMVPCRQPVLPDPIAIVYPEDPFFQQGGGTKMKERPLILMLMLMMSLSIGAVAPGNGVASHPVTPEGRSEAIKVEESNKIRECFFISRRQMEKRHEFQKTEYDS